ncbi:MAG: SGNH/GDSL hydrolase family protein [Gemmatimonadota bacterium]|nr:SGNH/GDSL hydrolase family protein [Gemmatimonadota bacterium]
MRLARPAGGLPLFVRTELNGTPYLIANRTVGARWFPGLDKAPSPAAEPFLESKPARGYRVFVLGESSAAGFPYPRNAMFSRLLGDVLRDAMPGDSVEVVNLGIAATNSFTMLDVARDVAAQQPDAVLIYGGHNEYYGAFGAASRMGIPGGTAMVRAYLRLMRLRTVAALQSAFARARRGGDGSANDLEAASLMEVLARDRQVPLESPGYERGLRQFEANLASIIRVLTSRGIPVLVGSVASNLRDQPPFAAEANSRPGGAVSVFEGARSALAKGDTTAARGLFERARDLDVIRFRAPAALNKVVRSVTSSTRATYVPVAEAFARASPGGIPGSNLFLEHVHPNREGYALLGRVFFEELVKARRLGPSFDSSRVRPWEEYSRGTTLTRLDERIAQHLTATLVSRWPFVPVERQTDYRGSYVPANLIDSLAFAVSRGERWEAAKLRLGEDYERRKQYDSAAAEYAGLARDAPVFAEPLMLVARALDLAGRAADAEAALRRAVAIRPSAAALTSLATRAFERRAIPEGIALSERSLTLQQNQPDLLYQLALAYGMSRDVPNARATALRLARIAPRDPRLPELLDGLGMRR